jgi:hypothetical protein
MEAGDGPAVGLKPFEHGHHRPPPCDRARRDRSTGEVEQRGQRRQPGQSVSGSVVIHR